MMRIANTFFTVDVPSENPVPARRARSSPPRGRDLVALAFTSGEQREATTPLPQTPALAQRDRPNSRWADIVAETNTEEADPLEYWVGDVAATEVTNMGGNWEQVRPSRVLLKNIPNRVRESEMLAAIVGMGFEGDVIRLDLPWRLDKKRPQNKGYAFVWLAEESTGERFCQAASGFSFGDRESSKALIAILAN